MTHDDGVVIIAVQGAVTSTVGDEIMQRGTAALRQHGAQRLMESTVQLIRRAQHADELGIVTQTRVAMLCAVRTPEHEFLDALACIRG